jgi:[ribosomal protein S5]-alanine N-acetyltransferase
MAIVTARLVLRPITAEEVWAVLNGQRRSDWATDFPGEGDQVIAGLLARSGLPADDGARRFGHRLVVERDTSTVVGGAGFFGPPQEGEVETRIQAGRSWCSRSCRSPLSAWTGSNIR